MYGWQWGLVDLLKQPAAAAVLAMTHLHPSLVYKYGGVSRIHPSPPITTTRPRKPLTSKRLYDHYYVTLLFISPHSLPSLHHHLLEDEENRVQEPIEATRPRSCRWRVQSRALESQYHSQWKETREAGTSFHGENFHFHFTAFESQC